MSDDAPLPSASPLAPTSPPDDQAARIDQLLTAGLDEYFAGRHDRAVQVWSRVFFLDRTNARARAYIERARGALAERQRVAEANAADAADLRRDEAARGTEGRPRPDDLLVVSGALAARLAPPMADLPAAPAPAAPSAASRRARLAHVLLVAAAGVLLFVAGYTVAARDRLAEWVNGVVTRPEPGIQNADAAAVALHDARVALDARRYDDARRALARIPIGDPLRPEADRLTAQLQRAWPITSPMLAPDAPVRGAGSP
jgi:hypothetical protein